jgi:type I restriction enzyme S subunit
MSSPAQALWPEVRIGDVLTYLNERVDLDDAAEYLTITVKRRHGGLEERERIFGHQIQTKKQFRLIPGAFIISRVQCWHQAYAMVPDDIPPNMIASINYDQFAVSPKVDRRFFWWFSHSPYFTDTVRSSAFGVVIEKMVFNRDAWLEKKIPLPPFEEQCRIVARIEELAAKIEEARDLRKHAAGEAEALVQNAIGGVIGEGWPEVPLQDAVDPERPITYGIVQAGEHFPDGVPYIRVSDMAKPRLTPEGMLRTAPEIAARYRRSAVRAGDIVFAIRATVGKMRFLPDDLDGANLTQGTARIAPSNKTTASYLFWALQSRKVNETIQNATKGSTFREITLGRLRTIPIPLPPLQEQNRIVAYLDDLQQRTDSLKVLQAETSAELDAFMPSILDKAFRGEL